MTTIYDPKHPLYRDEADVRAELSRVADICHGCRRCTDLCTVFPTLFEMIDQHDDHDAGRMTPAGQDQVVDACFGCKLCAVNCPYTPELHDWKLDFPRLMLRAKAMQHQHGLTSIRSKATTQLLGRTDLLGRVATAAAPVANRVVTAAPGSMLRKLTAKLTGVSSIRLLSPFAAERFSAWFAQRPNVRLGNRQGRVTVYPTCLVEYRAPAIGKDLVKVYERNGIECSNSAARCCGAPWLHSGDIEQFAKIAKKNVAKLAKEIRSGTDVVVAQPTCSYILKHDYVDHVGGADAELVAEHTYDAAEYLMKIHKADDTVLDTDFDGETIDKITYHAPGHLRAQHIGYESRDLMMLTGARVELVQESAGVDAMWGLRAENEAIAVPIAERFGETITAAAGDAVAGDSHLANNVIREQTGRTAMHPVQVIARAYGIPKNPEFQPKVPNRPHFVLARRAIGHLDCHHASKTAHESWAPASTLGVTQMSAQQHTAGHDELKWWDLGACKGLDAAMFYPDDEPSAASAKEVCASCAVQSTCLEHALTIREKAGVWGGATERDRRRIIRQRRKRA